MNLVETFIFATMILTVVMFGLTMLIAGSHREHRKHDYSMAPAIACCCIGGIVIVMISMLTFLLANGFGQYLFV